GQLRQHLWPAFSQRQHRPIYLQTPAVWLNGQAEQRLLPRGRAGQDKQRQYLLRPIDHDLLPRLAGRVPETNDLNREAVPPLPLGGLLRTVAEDAHVEAPVAGRRISGCERSIKGNEVRDGS